MKDFINDDSVVNAIAEVMTNDKFWGARYEAAQMLSNSTNTNKIVQDIYLKKLVEENDSRVRRSYITGLGNLFEKNPELKENISVLEFFLKTLSTTKPAIMQLLTASVHLQRYWIKIKFMMLSCRIFPRIHTQKLSAGML